VLVGGSNRTVALRGQKGLNLAVGVAALHLGRGTTATRRMRTMGIRDKPIAPGSPWQNCFARA
jgi:hypothetical protein